MGKNHQRMLNLPFDALGFAPSLGIVLQPNKTDTKQNIWWITTVPSSENMKTEAKINVSYTREFPRLRVFQQLLIRMIHPTPSIFRITQQDPTLAEPFLQKPVDFP